MCLNERAEEGSTFGRNISSSSCVLGCSWKQNTSVSEFRGRNHTFHTEVWTWHESTTDVTELNPLIDSLFPILTNSIIYCSVQVGSLW
jgi:hypothetical protein